MPDGLTEIENYAFYNCSSLSDVTMGVGLTNIESYSFYGCVNLTAVNLPVNVAFIEAYAFSRCMGLKSITVDAQNMVFSSVDGVLFNKGQTALMRYPEGRVGVYTIPDGVISIEGYAFSSCNRLTDVTIPSSVVSIGTYAFSSCSGLTDVTIPDGVTTIGEGAFSGCTGLATVTVPASVTSSGDWTFSSCASLKQVHFRGDAPREGSYVFYGDNDTTVYYDHDRKGWGSTYAGRPAVALGAPVIPLSISAAAFAVDRFGFTINGAADQVVIVEACNDLGNPTWSAISTNTLTGGTSSFSDPASSSSSTRVYRLRLP
jgi:hypothetical protein